MPDLTTAGGIQPVGESLPGWTPPSIPGGVALPGRFVDVVPFADEHLDGLYDATCGPGREHLWTYMAAGPFPDVAALGCYVAGMQQAADVTPYAVVVDGTVLGIATYLRIAPAAGSIEVGSITYGPQLQHTAAATEAMTLMAAHAFDLGYRRYEWKCDSLNEPSRRAALRLGFTYEGRFRQALIYKGRNRDTDWFSLIDREWPAVGAAHRSWLAGIDAQGRQNRSLGELVRESRENRLS